MLVAGWAPALSSPLKKLLTVHTMTTKCIGTISVLYDTISRNGLCRLVWQSQCTGTSYHPKKRERRNKMKANERSHYQALNLHVYATKVILRKVDQLLKK